MTIHLHHDHQELLANLVGGKLPRNLSWSAVVELIGQIGEVEPHGNDEFVFAVGAERGFFKRPSSHSLDVAEVSRLRKFLKVAEFPGKPANAPEPGRMVVVIDHHAAHVYHDLGGSVPEDGTTIKPYDPFHFQHHLVHRKEAHYKGEHVPEEASFYEEIAGHLIQATGIVLIGHGTGKSNAASFLSDYLKAHHPETFAHILATENADLSALTEPQVEQIAKKHLSATPDTVSA